MTSAVEKAIVKMGPFQLYWAGLAMGLGFLAAAAVGRRWAYRNGFSPSAWWGAATGTMFVALIGARVGYILMNWSYFFSHPMELWQLPVSGLSYYGGLLAGVGMMGIWAWRYERFFWAVADLFALPLITGLLVAVLIWRSPMIWTGLPSWAAILSELIYVSGIYAVLWAVGYKQREPSFDGELFLVAVTGESLMRFVFGSIVTMSMPTGWLSAWISHLAHLAVGAVALGLYWSRAGGWRPFVGVKPAGSDQRPPLTRWIGWLAMYGFIVSVHVVFRAVAH